MRFQAKTRAGCGGGQEVDMWSMGDRQSQGLDEEMTSQEQGGGDLDIDMWSQGSLPS